ncbi:MAG: hypothetical protein JW874_15695 [Spirochaetales bacterium]|nr:hypothetical protein [Spirochaetales bacterium]
MVFNDRERLTVSILLGSAVYIFSILLIFLFIEISSRSNDQFKDLVYVELARDTQVIDLTRKVNEIKDDKKNDKSKEKEKKDKARQEAASVTASARNQEVSSQSASSSRDRTEAGGGSSGNRTAQANASVRTDAGTNTSSTNRTSFSSRGTPNTFSSNTTRNTDLSSPDFPDSESDNDFFEDENVSSYRGTADPQRSFSSAQETRGNTVLDIRDPSTNSASSRTGSGSNSTSGLGQASERGGAANNNNTGKSGDSSIVVDDASSSPQSATVSETQNATSRRSLTGTETRSGSSSSNNRSNNDTGSGSDKSNAELYGINVEGDARFRKIISGPNKLDLEKELRLYREYLPPSRLIKIRFTVTPQGSITDLNLLSALGYSKVEAAILNWMRGFRFSQISTDDFVTGVISIRLDME